MKKLFSVLMVGVFVFMMALPALAGNTSQGTEFQSLYNKIVGWVTGLPGIVIGIFLGIAGIHRAFGTGQVTWAFGGLAAAACLLLLPTIITSTGFGATV